MNSEDAAHNLRICNTDQTGKLILSLVFLILYKFHLFCINSELAACIR